MSVHIKGHFATCKAAVPEMIKQKSGRIINFSSRGATVGGGSTVYSTAKAGILGFTTALAADLNEYGITVNAMLPSAVTELFPYPKKRMEDNLPVAEIDAAGLRRADGCFPGNGRSEKYHRQVHLRVRRRHLRLSSSL